MDRFAVEVAGRLVHRRTPAPRSSRAPRSAPTPPARRPRARTASAAESTERLPGTERRNSTPSRPPDPPTTRARGRQRSTDDRRTMTTQRAIGYVFVAVVVIGGIVFVVGPACGAGRKEAGSEIELAANRKARTSTDEELEGPQAQPRALGAVRPARRGRPGAPDLLAGRARSSGGRRQGLRRDLRRARPRRSTRRRRQCVNCHGPDGVGGVGELRHHRRERRLRLAGELEGAGAQHRAVPLLRG